MENLESNLYDANFYGKRHFFDSYYSAKRIVPIILKLIKPKNVVDLGCGIGSWLKVFKEEGIKEVLGIDFNKVDEKMFVIGRDEFLRFDLRKPLRLKKKFDLAISMEVAEHIEEKYSKIFVESLTNLSNIILFSAAIPKQGGCNHVNEQYPNYWAKLFEKKGYISLDLIRPHIILDSTVGLSHRQNSLLFVKKEVLKKEAYKFLPFFDKEKVYVHRTIAIQYKNPLIRFSYRLNNELLGGFFNSIFDKIFLKSFFGDLKRINIKRKSNL